MPDIIVYLSGDTVSLFKCCKVDLVILGFLKTLILTFQHVIFLDELVAENMIFINRFLDPRNEEIKKNGNRCPGKSDYILRRRKRVRLPENKKYRKNEIPSFFPHRFIHKDRKAAKKQRHPAATDHRRGQNDRGCQPCP